MHINQHSIVWAALQICLFCYWLHNTVLCWSLVGRFLTSGCLLHQAASFISADHDWLYVEPPLYYMYHLVPRYHCTNVCGNFCRHLENIGIAVGCEADRERELHGKLGFNAIVYKLIICQQCKPSCHSSLATSTGSSTASIWLYVVLSRSEHSRLAVSRVDSH